MGYCNRIRHWSIPMGEGTLLMYDYPLLNSDYAGAASVHHVRGIEKITKTKGDQYSLSTYSLHKIDKSV